MIRNRHKVFIDFDGTITTEDLGYEMFRKFTSADTEPLVQQYRRGEINSLQCLGGECEIWNRHAPDPKSVFAFIESFQATPGFKELIALLRRSSIKPLILSEGFDFYIDHFLRTNSLGDIAKITNKAMFTDGKLTPEFPYNKLGCDSCSSCKGYHIGQLRAQADSVIFIGDGHSDLHGSQAAEIVFAKSHLAEIMSLENRCFIPYDNFFDVAAKLEDIIKNDIFMTSGDFKLCYVSERHRGSIERLWESGDVMKNVGYPDGLGLRSDEYSGVIERLNKCEDAIYLAIEDKTGAFLGEAKLAFPDDGDYCHHDLKLLPEFQGRGIGYQAWRMLLDRTHSRWPQSIPTVTPSVDNYRAIALYHKLGFDFKGDVQTWAPKKPNAMTVNYHTMIYNKF